jgi:hypothetical protein
MVQLHNNGRTLAGRILACIFAQEASALVCPEPGIKTTSRQQ